MEAVRTKGDAAIAVPQGAQHVVRIRQETFAGLRIAVPVRPLAADDGVLAGGGVNERCPSALRATVEAALVELRQQRQENGIRLGATIEPIERLKIMIREAGSHTAIEIELKRVAGFPFLILSVVLPH